MPTPPGVPAIVESHDPSYPIYIQNHAAGSNSRRAISPKACGFSLRVQTMMTGFYSLGVDASAHHHDHHQRPSQHAHQTKRIRHTRSVLSPLSYARRPQRALPSNYQRSELIWRKTEPASESPFHHPQPPLCKGKIPAVPFLQPSPLAPINGCAKKSCWTLPVPPKKVQGFRHTQWL